MELLGVDRVMKKLPRLSQGLKPGWIARGSSVNPVRSECLSNGC